jgi:hypothetical protein
MKRLLLILFLSLSLCFPAYGADGTITEQTALGAKPASDDELVIWDSSTGSTKKVDYTYFEDIKNVNLYGGLTAAVASLSTTEVSLRITDSQTVTDNLSIPTTMQLVIDRGGDIAISAGKVLTVNGTIRAGSYQIFSGSGTVTFSGSGIEYGAWKSGGTDAIRGKVTDLGRYAADAETSDTYVITLSPAPTAYYTGMVIHFYAKTANTGACTLNVNGLGAKTIKKFHDQDTATGDIEAGQHVVVEYDGTNFQMQSQTASGATGVEDDVYGAGWNGDTTSAPSQNAVYDKINVIDKAILGDDTAGRVMRRIYVQIDNGTNANTIKAESFSLWQGDVNSEEDNLAKSGDTGNFALNASGSNLYLQVSGITGNCVTVLNGHVIRNASGTDMTVQLTQSSSGIQFTFLNATSAAAIDLTTAVDTGYIQISVLYLTDA